MPTCLPDVPTHTSKSPLRLSVCCFHSTPTNPPSLSSLTIPTTTYTTHQTNAGHPLPKYSACVSHAKIALISFTIGQPCQWCFGCLVFPSNPHLSLLSHPESNRRTRQAGGSIANTKYLPPVCQPVIFLLFPISQIAPWHTFLD